MTNTELEELTTLAARIKALLPMLLLDGDGQFRNPITVGFHQVPASDVLRMMTQAAAEAQVLHAKLAALPRITRTRKPQGEQLALSDCSSNSDA